MLDLPGRLRRRHRGAAASRSRSPPATPTASTSPGGRTAPSSPSSPPGTRGPTATWSATSTRSAPDGTGLRRVTDSRGDCALPAYDPDGRTLYVTAVPDLGPDGAGLRRPAGGAVPGRRGGRCAGAAARPGGAPPRRRDAGDGRGRRRACWSACSARARWSCCGCRWTAVPPEPLIDGPFTVRGVAAGGRRRRRRRRARPVGRRADRAHARAAAGC